MKFIHAADLHLDSSSSKIKKLLGQKEISIIEASQRAFVSLVDYAIEQEVDFIVLSGDLFDANWKDYSIGLFFIEQIKRLDIPVYYIRGNHDSENRLFKSLPFPKNFRVFKSEAAETILNDDLKVAIHGQSYAKYHIKDDLAARYPGAVPGYFNMGLLHTSGEKHNGELPYAPYDKNELLKKKYDYWALGHIHSSQIISKDPYIIYSGVTQGRHVKETGPKGCYLVSVEGHEVASLNFKRLGCVQWEVMSLNISKINSEEALKKKIIDNVGGIIRKEPKELGFVIRFAFEGNCFLEKRIHKNKEYYKNAIYCWLSDVFEQAIYIEKVIDRAQYKNKSDNKRNQSQIWTHIQEGLEKENAKEEVEKLVKDEVAFVLEKIPPKVLNEIRDEEMESMSKDSFIRIKHYLESKISKGAHENSSS